MRALIQRVSEASVEVAGQVVSRIGRGFLVFVAAEKGDGAPEAEETARKIAGLRIFADEQGRMNRSLGDVAGAVLAVSQFTLRKSVPDADIVLDSRHSENNTKPIGD